MNKHLLAGALVFLAGCATRRIPCSYSGSPKTINLRDTTPTATPIYSVVDLLLKRVYLDESIEIRNTKERNELYAVVEDTGRRAVVVDPEYFDDIDAAMRSNAIKFAIAHELGHHIYGHTTETLFSSEPEPRREFEADAFAARLLRSQKMARDDVLAAFNSLRPKLRNATPSADEREKKLGEAWDSAEDPTEPLQSKIRDLEKKNDQLSGNEADLQKSLGDAKRALLASNEVVQRLQSETDGKTSEAERALVASKGANSYVLDEVLMRVVLADRGVDFKGPGSFEARSTITYLLATNRALAPTDFLEGYHSETGAKVDWVPSTHVESPGDQPADRYIIPAISGRRGLIQTAASYTYSLPFADSRNVHGISVGPTEDVWCYRNDTDFIGRLTIAIESASDLQSPRSDDGRVLGTSASDGSYRLISNVTPTVRTENGRTVLFATFTNVNPGQRAILIIRRK